MGLADPRRWPRPWTGDRGGRLRCPGAQRQVLASRSQDVSSALHVASGETLPGFLPQEATVGPRAPAKGHDFPRGGGGPGLCAPCWDQHMGARGERAGWRLLLRVPPCLPLLPLHVVSSSHSSFLFPLSPKAAGSPVGPFGSPRGANPSLDA